MVGSATKMLEIEVVICSFSGFILKRKPAICTVILIWNYQEPRQKQYKSIIFGLRYKKYVQLYAKVRKKNWGGGVENSFRRKTNNSISDVLSFRYL